MALGKLPNHLGGLVNRYGFLTLSVLSRRSANSWHCLQPQFLSVAAGPLAQVGPISDPIPKDKLFDPSHQSTVHLADNVSELLTPETSSSDPQPTTLRTDTQSGYSLAVNRKNEASLPFPDEKADRTAAFLRIKADGNLTGIIKNVQNRLKEGRRVVLFVTGQGSVNTAVKSIVLARRSILENADLHDIGFKAVYQQGATEDRITRFMLALDQVDFKVTGEVPQAEAFKAHMRTNGRELASMIVEKLGNGGDMAVNAMGPRPIAATVVALTFARRQLMDAGFDCLCFPSFTKLMLKDRGEMSAIQLRMKRVPFDADKDFKKEWYPSPAPVVSAMQSQDPVAS